MPCFRATITVILRIPLGSDLADDQERALIGWAAQTDHARTAVRLEDCDESARWVVTEVRALEAPAAGDAERMAWRAFGAAAFDASLPPGPESWDVQVEPASPSVQ